MKRIRMRVPSPSAAVAVAALIVATAGTAWAASLPKNSVTARSIRSNAVGASEIKKGAVRSSEVKDGTLRASDFASGVLLKGDKGDKGDTGPAGPSEVREAKRTSTNFVTISSTSSAAETLLATLSNLPAGAYVVTARTGMNTSGTDVARVVCNLKFGGVSSPGIATIGSNAGAQAQSSIAATIAITTASAGDATYSCHTEGLAGSSPFASEVHLQAMRVGSVTSTEQS